MDERILFDQFHEALEMEPRPGAYERMRFAMTSHPVAANRRPAFRMRWSKMGLRVTAVIAAAVIAIAIGAVILASHQRSVGSVNAGPTENVKAYRALILADYNTFSATTSNNCNTVKDAVCGTAVSAITPTLEKWVSDLASFQTPAAYIVLDGQLRRHLTQAITLLNALAAFQTAKNENGFNLAMNAALYERAWIDPAVFFIEGQYPGVAGSYHNALNLARQSVVACKNQQPGPGDLSCARLVQQETCAGAAAPMCQSDVQGADTQVQTLLIALLENPAPSPLTKANANLEGDLANADRALLAITSAVLAGDSAKVLEGENSYIESIDSADVDVAAIGIV